jgi:hypothetical protein
MRCEENPAYLSRLKGPTSGLEPLTPALAKSLIAYIIAYPTGAGSEEQELGHTYRVHPSFLSPSPLLCSFVSLEFSPCHRRSAQ